VTSSKPVTGKRRINHFAAMLLMSNCIAVLAFVLLQLLPVYCSIFNILISSHHSWLLLLL